jgi:hypothetical protein
MEASPLASGSWHLAFKIPHGSLFNLEFRFVLKALVCVDGFLCGVGNDPCPGFGQVKDGTIGIFLNAITSFISNSVGI